MQVNNQNVGQIPRTFTANCNCCTQPQQPVVAQPQQLQTPVSNYQQPVSNVPVQPQYNPQYCAPQYAQYPQQQQSIRTASASAVNIQIYNPKVGPENANGNGIGNQYQQPIANGCYPSGYYTGQYGTNGVYYPNMPLPTQNTSGLDQTNGNNAYNNGLNTTNGATNGTNNNANAQNGTNDATNKADTNGNNINGQNGNASSTDSNNNGEKSESDKTGAADAGAAGAGAGAAAANTAKDANNNADGTGTEKTSDSKTSTEQTDDKKKTEKKKVVELTDTYIKNLENYLDSQEKDIRLNAAKEVYARLAEDETRKDDKALTALINKMLQDPAEEIRLLALSALESRIVTGDDYTTGVLQQMQQSKDGYGQDAIDASKILLQMSGKQVEKEVPVKEKKPEKKETKETKTTTTTETKSEDKKGSSKA